MLVFMSIMFTLRENIVDELAKILHDVRKHRASTKDHSSQEMIKEHATEALDDIHCKLCHFMSMVIAAPLSGRIFLTKPQGHLEPFRIKESALSHLRPE